MRVGYFAAHERYAPDTLLDHVEAADSAGFHSVWTSDHIHPWWDTDAHCGAAWPWLGAALERAPSIRMGTGVTPPMARYHPGMVAQTFATLGAMYPGRVHLAIGTGEAMNETPFGYDWPPYEERRKRLVDACEIIHRLWDGGFHDYDGHYWEIDTCKLYTLPDERIPLYIAGNGPRTARVAGRYADGFYTIPDIETYEETLAPALEEGAEEAGRDPDDIARIRHFGLSYGEDYDEALESAGFWRGPRAIGFHQDIHDPREIERRGRELSLGAMEDAWLITDDPDDINDVLKRHEDAGFDEVVFQASSCPSQEDYIEAVADLGWFD